MKDQVIVPKKKQKLATQNDDAEAPRPVSKSEQRKLKQIERRKEAQARARGAVKCAIAPHARSAQFHVRYKPLPLAEALAVLDASKLDSVSQKLLLSSSQRGAQLTAKQRLKRDKVLRDAGLDLPQESRLFKRAAAEPDEGKTRNTMREDRGAEANQVAEHANADLTDSTLGDDDWDVAASNTIASKDLSMRDPPVAVSFRRAKATTCSDAQPEMQGSVSKEALTQQPAQQASSHASKHQMQRAEELRAQLIQSGEIKGTQWGSSQLCSTAAAALHGSCLPATSPHNSILTRSTYCSGRGQRASGTGGQERAIPGTNAQSASAAPGRH
jgi:hypothetical protein